MRWVLAALALLLVPLPAVHAQDATSAPAALLDDKSGDFTYDVAGTATGNPSGQFAASDLVALTLDESADTLTFHLTVANLAPSPEPPQVESTVYTIGFDDGGVSYRVGVYRQVSDHANYYSWFSVYDPGRGDYGGDHQLTITAAGNTIDVAVP